MTIFIDLVYGNDGAVFDDLVQIARCDPGLTTFTTSSLGSGGGLPPGKLQVSFVQKQAGVTSSNRLLALVEATRNIMIIGVDSTFVVNGVPITVYAGITLWDHQSSTSDITIYIDNTDAGGVGYEVRAADVSLIDFPPPVILYHELAHAYHAIIGDEPTNPQQAEIKELADENGFRAQLGLPLRSSFSHYGGLGREPGQIPFPLCEPKAVGWTGCLVATAAVGSAQAPQVAALRRARSEYRGLSEWMSLICGPVLESYARFSPMVVRDMKRDPALSDAILQYVVLPAAHLLDMVEKLMGDSDDPRILEGLEETLDRYAGGLTPECAAGLPEAAAAALQAYRPGDLARQSPSPPPDLRLPDELFDYLASVIASSGPSDTTAIAWAFDGLGLFLGQAAQRSDERGPMTPDFALELGAWRARLPIPPDARLNIEDAESELTILGARILTDPHTRELFAKHLLARWPQPTAAALQSLLRRLGYIHEEH